MNGTENETRNVILPYDKTEEIYIEPVTVKTTRIYRVVKRTFDIAFSLLVIIIFFVPSAVIALCVKLTSKGPAFFTQERMGRNGVRFRIIKFRTMVDDAEKNGARWTLDDNDERVTLPGRFLRKTRLDELPQFLNILSGQMTLIGPRPERAVFYEVFETYIHGFSERLKVKPGLTGYAQVYGGYKIPPEKKIIYDIDYIKNQSLWMDIKIFFKTIQVFFVGEKAKGTKTHEVFGADDSLQKGQSAAFCGSGREYAAADDTDR